MMIQLIAFFLDIEIEILSLGTSKALCNEKCTDLDGYLPYFFQGQGHSIQGSRCNPPVESFNLTIKRIDPKSS